MKYHSLEKTVKSGDGEPGRWKTQRVTHFHAFLSSILSILLSVAIKAQAEEKCPDANTRNHEE
jgi:hypothetical protein